MLRRQFLHQNITRETDEGSQHMVTGVDRIEKILERA
jgi:hypothetical protein